MTHWTKFVTVPVAGLLMATAAALTLTLGAQADEPPRPETPKPPPPNVSVIRNSGNGVGNNVVIDNGPAPGQTIVDGSRIGIGNRLVIINNGKTVVVKDGKTLEGQEAEEEVRRLTEEMGRPEFWDRAAGSWFRAGVTNIPWERILRDSAR